MPPSLESSLALSKPPSLKQKTLVLDVPVIRNPQVRNTGKAPGPRIYGDEPLPVKPSELAPRNGHIVGRVAEFGQIPVYTLKVGETEINDIKLWEILDYVSPLELERYENQQFKEEAVALEAARAAAEIEKDRRRLKQAAKAKSKGIVVFEEINSDDVDSADADGANARHGRARPTYTGFFQKPTERRRRRKRDPETGELMSLSGEDSDAANDSAAANGVQKRRRRRRDPETGVLMPLSDREEDDEASSPGNGDQVSAARSSAPPADEQKKRRRRKRDPKTGALMPLSDREEDSEMRSSGDDGAASSVGPFPSGSVDLLKRRRRKRDPITGVLLPLEPIGKSSEAGSDHKRRRRRSRHPLTGVLMPLAWRYDPEQEKKSTMKGQDTMSPALRKMSITQEHGSKRIKLASDSDDISRTRSVSGTSTQMPFRGTPAKAQLTKTLRQSTISTSESDELGDGDGFHRPVSASKPKPAQKTSILNPIVSTGDSSDDSMEEPITLASFLKGPRKHDDTDEDSHSSDDKMQAVHSQLKTSLMNPVASQKAAAQSDENDDDDELDEDEWFVEAIIGHRMSDPKSHPGRKQVVLYHTKWEGSDELTWEPVDSFGDPSTVNDYRKRAGLDKEDTKNVKKQSPAKQPAQVVQPNSSRVPQPGISATATQQQESSEEGSEKDEDEEGWEVESILAHHMSDPRTHPGKPQTMLYKVKWVGWNDPTWEPVASFPDKAVVNVYRRKVGLIPV